MEAGILQNLINQNYIIMNILKSNNPIDTFIRIVVLSILMIWSAYIAKPFILLIVWSILVAVALYPLQQKFVNLFKGKIKKRASTLFILILLALVIVPTTHITESILESSKHIFTKFKEGTLEIPPPDESVKGWPLVGEKVHVAWTSASQDLEGFIRSQPEKVEEYSGWLFGSFKGLMSAVLLSLVALIIAGIFMSSAESGYKTGVKFANRLMAGKGEELMHMCVSTIRSVVKGILLVAIIQGIFAYIGFSVIGLSTAGILAFVVLIAAIIQVPVALVMVPIIISVFSTEDTTPAIIFAIYSIVVALLDNVLKPLLLAKGLQTPMIIILIGAIGGMILQGILGLFIGPVVLAIAHRLYCNWVEESAEVV